MGDPKFSRSQWSSPSHPWIGARIKAESSLRRKYGLKNKREIWQAAGKLRAWRGQARLLQARIQRLDKQAETERDLLIAKLTRLSLLQEGATLDDVLGMELDAVLARRFQSQVYLKGMAKTTGHARQLIAHGHFAIAGRKVTVPSYLLHRGEEDQISYYGSSPMNRADHAMRPPPEFRGVLMDYKVDDEDQGRDGGFRRRVKVHVPVPVDQVDETVGDASAEEKTKDITELAPEGAVEAEAELKNEKVPPKPAARAADKPAGKPAAKKPKKEE